MQAHDTSSTNKIKETHSQERISGWEEKNRKKEKSQPKRISLDMLAFIKCTLHTYPMSSCNGSPPIAFIFRFSSVFARINNTTRECEYVEI